MGLFKKRDKDTSTCEYCNGESLKDGETVWFLNQDKRKICFRCIFEMADIVLAGKVKRGGES